MLLHRDAILQQRFAQVIFLRRKLLSSKDSLRISIFLLIFERGVFTMRFSPVSSVVSSNIFYYLLDCIWVTYGLVTKAHSFPS